MANFFLGKGREQGVPVTHLKLQKLVAIAYGFHEAIHGDHLFDEDIQAWDYGPVVPQLYYEFKRFGHHPISEPSRSFDHISGRFHVPEVSDSGDRKLLEDVWMKYGRLTAVRLVDLTHSPGTPWHDTASNGGGKIDPDCIRRYYYDLVRKYHEGSP